MSLRDEMVHNARTAGGSFKTRSDRESIVSRFAEHLKNDLNIQIRQASQIKIVHIEKYVEHRLSQGISQRTMQNEMAAIRSVLRVSGREQLLNQDRLANKALGLEGVSRQGTKTAISEERYQQFIKMAEARDQGVAACVALGRELGLRAEEAVQSSKSLSTWAKQLDAGKSRLEIIFGTKGGRSREVHVTEASRARIVTAVKNAQAVAKTQGGKLIDKPDLKAAIFEAICAI